MSKYTTELRYICEVNAGETESTGYNDVQEIIDNSWDKIFSFDFPIFDENYREGLCKKIIKHYYTREIAEETYGLWKLRLDARMNEIMPYFNKLYESELIAIEPLVNYRMNKSGNGSKGGTDGITDNGSESVMGNVNGSKVKTGNETLNKAGKEIDTKSGTKTNAKIGNIEDTTEYDGDKTNTRKVLDGTLDTTDKNYILINKSYKINRDNFEDFKNLVCEILDTEIKIEKKPQKKSEEDNELLSLFEKKKAEYEKKYKKKPKKDKNKDNLTIFTLINYIIHYKDTQYNYDTIRDLTIYQIKNTFKYYQNQEMYELDMKYRTSGNFKMDKKTSEHWFFDK